MAWLREVRKSVAELLDSPVSSAGVGLSLADIPQILGAYDFFHRVSNGLPCNDYIRETVLKSAERYFRGDRSLSHARVALMLQREADRDILSMPQRYMEFSGKAVERWIDNLQHTRRLENVTESDSYDILGYLLPANLSAYGIRLDSKKRWIDSYTLTGDALESLDTRTLWRYVGFNRAAEIVSGKSLAERDASYATLFSMVAARNDLHPFFREALAIDLTKYQTA